MNNFSDSDYNKMKLKKQYIMLQGRTVLLYVRVRADRPSV